ncbi:MAG: hypothetical protein RLY58_2232 [Pseudomonadota bacterium]|jgi:methylisocitrate lyase
MSVQTSAGRRFRDALVKESPLQIIGTVNAYAAMMARDVGYNAIYLSGAGVANYSYGLPDLAMTSLDEVLIDVRRITARVDTPFIGRH